MPCETALAMSARRFSDQQSKNLLLRRNQCIQPRRLTIEVVGDRTLLRELSETGTF